MHVDSFSDAVGNLLPNDPRVVQLWVPPPDQQPVAQHWDLVVLDPLAALLRDLPVVLLLDQLQDLLVAQPLDLRPDAQAAQLQDLLQDPLAAQLWVLLPLGQ
jgi:hypothetical protein